MAPTTGRPVTRSACSTLRNELSSKCRPMLIMIPTSNPPTTASATIWTFFAFIGLPGKVADSKIWTLFASIPLAILVSFEPPENRFVKRAVDFHAADQDVIRDRLPIEFERQLLLILHGVLEECSVAIARSRSEFINCGTLSTASFKDAFTSASNVRS